VNLLLQTEVTNKWKLSSDNKDTGNKLWICNDASSMFLKTITEKLDNIKKVEVFWKDINFEKLMAIITDFEKVMKRMQTENSGIVFEEMKTLKVFPDTEYEFNKRVWYVRQKIPMLSSRELLIYTFNKRIEMDGSPCLLNVMQSIDYPDTPVSEGAIRM